MTDDLRPLDTPPGGQPDLASDQPALTAPRSPVGVMDPEIQAAARVRRSGEAAGWGLPQAPAGEDIVPSTAAINGHPIHPMVVPLPIGLLTGSLLSDLFYVRTRDPFWARASLALTAGGVVSGLSAAVFGVTDFVTREPIRERPGAWVHGIGNALAMGLGALSVARRARDPEGAVIPTGLALSVTIGSMLLVTGWLGGELVYRDRIGLAPR